MKQSSIWYELETKGEYLMERTIVVANQKGGVGKTTTAINLAASLAELGKKVLVVDMDPQGNTTSGLGIDKEQAENTVYELMLEECSVEDAIMESEYENLSVLPSNINLAAAEIELVGAEEKEYILKKAIDKVKKNYDFVLIDCPPSLSRNNILVRRFLPQNWLYNKCTAYTYSVHLYVGFLLPGIAPLYEAICNSH